MACWYSYSRRARWWRVWAWWCATGGCERVRRRCRRRVVWSRVRVRRGIIAVRSPARCRCPHVGDRHRLSVGSAQSGEQERTTRMGDVGVAGRAGPDDRAVAQLLVAPSPERLDQMMKTAQTLQVRRLRGPTVDRGGRCDRCRRFIADSVQPGNRHVRSRHRTKSANPRDGTYPASGAAVRRVDQRA